MTDYVPAERATTIRQPSTANLMIDSDDRNFTVYPSPYKFQINKPNALINGFFTRVATTEVVLEWCSPNISADLSSNILSFDISGVGANTFNGTSSVTLPDGMYYVSEVVEAWIHGMNQLTGTTGATFILNNSVGLPYIDISGAKVTVNPTNLSILLDLSGNLVNTQVIGFGCPDIRPLRYIDFVSSQLTYAQEVKDASTSDDVRDVLCRWYFSEDVPEQLDSLGFPIYMGYKAFRRRRLFNPPKQIRWENNLPVGNLSFELYGPAGEILETPTYSSDVQWLMTLQISEV